MRKAIIYGTGHYYKQNRSKLPKDLEIVAYADSYENNATSHNGHLYEGMPVLLPEEFKNVEYDIIFICTDYIIGNQIFQKLIEVGIPSDHIQFLNRIDAGTSWNYTATDDKRGYISTIDGITVCERYLTDFDIVYEVLCRHSYRFKLLEQDCVVIDMGMNVAIASLYFANMSNVKKVYSYEAFQDTYEQGRANIALNSDEIKSKIIAENIALSDENITKKVAVSSEQTGWRTIFSTDQSKRWTEIVCRDAGEIVKKVLDKHQEKIILKIDTEGAEFQIFDSLDRSKCFERIDVIMMEYHGDSTKLISILEKYSYKIFAQGKRVGMGMMYAVK